jgi:predicted glycosyltransferase
MAGYNSLCESLRERKKALAVPRAGPSQEQRIRTRLFADRQLLAALEPEALTPERLAAELLALLGEDGIPDGASIPRMDGAELAAAQLVDGMRAREGEQPLVSVP